RFGEPVIGGVQDYISGAYIMTRKSTGFEKEKLDEIILKAGLYEDLKIDPKKREFTGKELFSMFLPDDLNVEYRSKTCKKHHVCEREKCPHDCYVVIKKGELLSGTIDGMAFKARSRCKLLDKLVKDYGSDMGRKFLDSVTKSIMLVLENKGLTTGIDDIELPREALSRIEEILEDGQKRVNKLIQTFEMGELEPLPGQKPEETLENLIMKELADTRDKAGEVAEEYLGLERTAVIMAKTGAKGNMLDLTQMTACLGQMSVRGKRLSRGYRKRSLSHFKRRELKAHARGFVRSSYKKGLNPIEFFFHAMGGREGLVDTAVRTAQSGYMQRRLMNAMQDLKVSYDQTVRNNDGCIIQFRYGEDGVDPAKSNYGKAVDIDWIIHKNLSRG
ncbi:MAG: DNA-directed RNA polymerase subunit A', partial [Candidatus Methanofastidiosia archaeon]